MPDRKKPSRPTSKTPASRRTAARKTTAPRTSAAKRAPSARPASRTRKPPAEILPPLDLEGIDLEDDEAPEDEPESVVGQAEEVAPVHEREPEVAIADGPFVDGVEPDPRPPMVVRFDDSEVPPSDEPDGSLGVERPREELIAGVVAALLAGSVFLPWFGRKPGPTFSGWSGGLWGPIVFFTALAVVAIVALRRARVPVALPVDHAAIIEAVGWLAVLGALPSRFLGVEVDSSDYKASQTIFVTIVLGIALVLVASRISSGSPFVLRPGWFSGVAGKVGAAVLAIAIVAGVGFGMTGQPTLQAGSTPGKGINSAKQYDGKLPPCAAKIGFPTPTGVKLGISYDGRDACTVTFSSAQRMAQVAKAYRTALRAKGFRFKEMKSPGATSFQFSEPMCGTLAVSEQSGAGTDRSKPNDVRTQGVVFFSDAACNVTPQRPGTTQPPS